MSINLPIPAAFTLSAKLGRAKLWLLGAVLILLPAMGWSQEYTVTDLGTLGGLNSSANAVNNLGQVVGSANVAGDGHADGFIYSNGTMTDVWSGGTLYGGTALAINDSGHYIGVVTLDSQGDTGSVLWNGSTLIDLGIGGAVSMNASDMVVGNDNNPPYYWVYVSGQLNLNPGYPLPVTTYTTFRDAQVLAVNNSGLIAADCIPTDIYDYAYQCVLSPNGSWVLEGTGDGAGVSTIRSDGTTCGFDNGLEFAEWSDNGTETVGDQLGVESWCSGLNDSGVGVGGYYPGYNSPPLPLIYDPLNGNRDLNDLVPHPNTIYRGMFAPIVVAGVAISDTGYIAANCLRKRVYGPSETHACLLTPNAVPILHHGIRQLVRANPDCEICKRELEPESKTLPEHLEHLSTREKEKVSETVGEMEAQLRAALDGDRITAPQEQLLLQDLAMVLKGAGTNLP